MKEPYISVQDRARVELIVGKHYVCVLVGPEITRWDKIKLMGIADGWAMVQFVDKNLPQGYFHAKRAELFDYETYKHLIGTRTKLSEVLTTMENYEQTRTKTK